MPTHRSMRSMQNIVTTVKSDEVINYQYATTAVKTSYSLCGGESHSQAKDERAKKAVSVEGS